MAKPTYAILSIQWANPYKPPPDGKAHTLWTDRVLWTGTEDETVAKPVYDRLNCSPGCGYALCISIEAQPGKPWPKETKARVRKQRLKRRLNNKFPLLADQFYNAEIEKRPHYFSGENP